MRYSLKARLARLWHDEGGWLSALLAGAGFLANQFSKGAQGAAQGRQAEANLLHQRDLLQNQQYNTAQNAQFNAGQLDLDRKRFSESARGGRAKQAAIADLLSNFQPTQINVPGVKAANISGGLQIGPGAKAALGNLYQQALAAQLQGDTFTGGELLKAPELSKLPEAGKWERLAGVLGTVGNIAGGVGSLLPQGPRTTDFSLQSATRGLPGGLPGTSAALPTAPPVPLPNPNPIFNLPNVRF